MQHRESRLQAECVKWFRLQYPKRIIFAIPNGGKRSAIEGSILKSEGVLAGVADLCIFARPNDDEGKCLWVEMKIEKGVQSDAQKEFERKCIEHGQNYAISRSFEQFVWIVRDFFTIPKPKKEVVEEIDESLLINILVE